MAETTVNKHFIKYSGTKDQFIAAGYPATYEDKIVFIKGGANGTGECIYTRGMYFANFNELITAYVAGMNFLKGVTVDGTSYNAAVGGGYVAFEATDPATVGVNVNQGKITIGLTTAFLNNITNLGTEITNIKNNYATTSAMNTAIGDAKTELKGTDGDTLNSETIKGAKKFAENVGNTVTTNLKGSDSDTADSETIAGAKKYAAEAGNGALDRAKAYADDVAGTAETNAKGYADTKKSEVIGTANDTSSVDTIKGVRKYVEEKTANIASDSRMQAVEGDVTTIKGDYLKSTDKTELGNRITNEAPVTIEEAAGSGDILKSYKFTQNGKEIGTINLAKELVVTKGEIVEIDGVKNLQLTIANQSTPVNIPVTELVDVYTAKANATQVQVAISNTNEISASVVASSITSAELDNNAVTTAKIMNNGVTFEKLSTGVQTSLGKADSAYQKPSNGIPKTDLVEGVQTSLSKADSAYQKPSNGIPTDDLASNSVVTAKITDKNVTKAKLEDSVQTSLDKADSALQSISSPQQGKYVNVGTKTNNAQTVGVIVKMLGQTSATQQGLADTHDVATALSTVDTNAQGYANTAESNAKSYADSQWDWLDLD